MACEYCTNDDSIYEPLFKSPLAVMLIDGDAIKFVSEDNDGDMQQARVEINY